MYPLSPCLVLLRDFLLSLLLLHLASALRVCGTWEGLNVAFVLGELHCAQPGRDDHSAFL